MSIISSLYQGVSGLNTNATGIEVVGNNIANVNTVGFKGSRVSFEELLGRTVLGGGKMSQLGAGAGVGSVEKLFNQGAFLSTGVSTDLAIAGDGFFIVNGDVGGTNGSFYTRAGQFGLDTEGYLTAGGLRVQGFGADGAGGVSDKFGDMKVPVAPLTPRMTSEVTLGLGLDASTPVNSVGAFDVNNPDSSDFSTTVTVYDSLGTPRSLEVHFTKTADNTWEWNAVADGSDIEGGTPDELQTIASGTLSFNADGTLADDGTNSIAVTFAGAGAQDIALDFGTSDAEGGADGTTVQFDDRVNQVLSIEQNGHGSGTLNQINVDGDGNIIGSYSNGEDIILGRIALARFAAPTGLENVGGNLFKATVGSGEPVVGDPNSGGRGAIIGGALEQSNIDLASEFVNMITAQRGYQANSRTITTADAMYAETVNLKS